MSVSSLLDNYDVYNHSIITRYENDDVRSEIYNFRFSNGNEGSLFLYWYENRKIKKLIKIANTSRSIKHQINKEFNENGSLERIVYYKDLELIFENFY